MGPLTFLRFVSLSGVCVSGAAAEPQRFQEAVRAAAGAGAGVDGNGRRGESQLHLDSSRLDGAASHVQRGAHSQLRRPGPDPQDGEPSRFSPAVESAAVGRPTGAEAADEAVWVRNSGQVSGGRNLTVRLVGK